MKTFFSPTKLLAGLMLLSFTTLFTSCEKDDDNAPALQTINGIVNSNANFSILKAAITRAGLGAALESGSLTVFAPDDAAFAAAGIDLNAVNSLPVADLTSILKYHVVGSKIPSSGVPASDTVKTLLGTNIYASKNANGVFMNGIKVKTADVAASNGTIHVISSVLIPPTETIAELISADQELSALLGIVAGIPAILNAANSPGKLTVFAPTNAAFSALTTPPSQADLPGIVQAHILGTSVFASDLINNATAPTLNSARTLVIGTNPASVKISGSAANASNVVEADLIATNGVIHKIDRVLLP